MGYYFPNVDPLYLYKRQGTAEDPFIPLQQDLTVKYTRVTLKEIPDFTTKVTVTDSNNITLTEVTTDTLQEQQYRVDYSTGNVYFHTSAENTKMHFSYLGTGYVNIGANRLIVDTSDTNGESLTVQDVLDEQGNINERLTQASQDMQNIEKQIQQNHIITEQEIGDLNTLQTTAKDTVVNAINENVEELNKKATESYIEESDFYEEITFEKLRDNISQTDYYLITIPNKDKNGNLIKLENGYANDVFNSPSGETARSFASRHNTSFVANASIFNMNTLALSGVQIQNGNILQNINNTTSYMLGIKEDNTLIAYPANTSASTILEEGCINAITGFFPLIENGEAVDYSVYNVIGNPQEAHPRNVIAQMPNKDLIFLTCEGETQVNAGMTYADLIRILSTKGVMFAYCLDGGGSSQSLVRGVMLNNPIDNSGKTERKVANFLYVKKYSNYYQKAKIVNQDLGFVNKRVQDLRADFTNLAYFNETAKVITDCNAIMSSGVYWANSLTANRPTSDISWAIINIKAGSASVQQIAIPYHSTLYQIRYRRTDSNQSSGWGAWSNQSIYDTPANLLNNWTNYGGNESVASYSLVNGIVYIKGVVKGGAASTVLFTLPVGMRPLTRLSKGTVCDNGSGATVARIIIEPNGEVKSLNAASNYLYIEASFPAQN